MTLAVWMVMAVYCYPLSKQYLARQGIDLDKLTSDPVIFEH